MSEHPAAQEHSPKQPVAERVKGWVRARSWQEWAVLVLLLVVAGTHATITSRFQHLPGPIYGGDYYWHYGHALHIRDGGSVLASSHYAGEYEHYPWLTHAVIALLSLVTGASVLQVTTAILPFITLFAGLAVFALGRRFLNATLAIPIAVFWAAFGDMPSATPTGIALKLAIPLVVLVLASVQSLRGRLLAGLVFGLAGLQHVVLFVGAGLLILVLAVFRMATGTGSFAARAKEQALFWLPVVGIGVPIALLFWWAPAFVYHNQTPNNWQEYTGIGLQSLSVGLTLSTLKGVFIPFRGLAVSAVSLFVILGAWTVFTRPRKLWIPLVVLLTGLAGFLHPLVTQPLFGFTIGFYRFPLWFVLGQALFFGAGLAAVYWTVKDNRARLGLVALAVLIGLMVLGTEMSRYADDRWIQYGQQLDGSTQSLLALGEWVRAHTDVDDVFLAAHEESGFAMNVLSGRKQVIARRTHTSPFVDVDRRTADVALMLYGADNETRRALLGKYGVKYYYEDAYSLQSRQECIALWDQLEQQGEASYACLRTSVAHEGELRAAGLDVKRVRARLDVASTRAPSFELLAIKPAAEVALAREPVFGNDAGVIAHVTP